MADVATTTGVNAPENETPTQRQARLRREKMKKKMTDQGESRLAGIRALNGGVAPPDEVLGGPTAPSNKIPTVHDDPEEVDISSYNASAANASQGLAQSQEFDLATALHQMQQQQQQQGQGTTNPQDDPMMRMMQQMMGAMGGQQAGAGGPNGDQQQLPPALQAMLGGGGAGGQQQDETTQTTGSTYLWRIVHAIFAFILAAYIALTSTFNGTKLARSQNVYTEEAGYGLGPRLFIIFTSSELVLQSTRYFLEKGRLQGGGMFATVANSGFVPEPYNHYVRVAGRYITIAKTIFSDMMVIVFVFGCLAWWNDMTLTTSSEQ